MCKQLWHRVQEFGVAGFLCFYAFSPEKLFLLQMPSAKAEKHIKAGTGKLSKNPDQTGYCKG